MTELTEGKYSRPRTRRFDDLYEKKFSALLGKADVVLEGTRPWDIKVKNDALFARVLGDGSLGLGEAYMDGWWECDQLDELFSRLLSAELNKQVTTWSERWFFFLNHLLNLQIGRNQSATAASHYEHGDDLYKHMLDPRMIYTCGYWKNAGTLEQAQEHKLELVAQKLKLKPGMRILDIGCGWGGSAAYLAEHHGVDVVGITLSQPQADFGRQVYGCSSVDIQVKDFRQVAGKFDRIYSLGMFEHVGFKNYADYFATIDRCLIDKGLFLLHTIGHRVTSHKVDPWIHQYIFPNSILPSAELISRHSAGSLNIEDWHNFGLDYHRTLMAWCRNCDSAWDELPNYDERFQRMWRYFLMCSAGAFKAQRNYLWQIVFSKGQINKAYEAVR